MITGDRVSLKHLGSAQRRALFQHFSCEQITHFMDMEPVKELHEVDELITYFDDLWAQRKGIFWGIFLNENDEFIGTAGLYNWNTEKAQAEISYDLMPAYWGRGLMHEALDLMIEFTFASLGISRLEAYIDPENARSCKVVEKLGFQYAGLQHEHDFYQGHFLDEQLYVRSKADRMPL